MRRPLLLAATTFSLMNCIFVFGCGREVPVVALGVATQDTSTHVDEPKANKADDLRHEDLDAILWVRTSGEYAALARQAYQSATRQIEHAVKDETWTASLEQKNLIEEDNVNIGKLPPAVILDVDETVLNNSDYQVDLVKTKSEYSRDSWKSFCKSQSSTAIPGAIEFVKQCRESGINVLFVTNREHEVESSTRENLIKVGLMKPDDPDIVYSKYEKDDWKSDKITRRTEIARQFRILLLLGDDLHDFASTGHHPSSKKRKEFATDHSDMWGTKWIVLPNPNYGGWEQSTYDWNNSSSSKTKLEKKQSRLDN